MMNPEDNLLVRTCTRRLEWDAAHRVMRHESKCASLHGHRYVAEIMCHANKLDDVGRVIDFGVVKEIVGKWIDDTWDHTTLVNKDDADLRAFLEEEEKKGKRPAYVFDGEPTAENIAVVLLKKCGQLLRQHPITVRSVKVYETPNCSADAQWVSEL